MTPLIPGTTGFVELLLADRIGLDVASVGEGVIVRGVANRMKEREISRQHDYERLLLVDAAEVQALIEEVVIPESWFFRDDRPFATFREFIQAGWVGQSNPRPLSVLCLPCASGEEPYSVAITLLELGLTAAQFEVVAIDISARSLRRAATGLYTRNAFRGIDPRLLADYFSFSLGKYQLKMAVRSVVRFEQGNILDPGLLAQHRGFHVVFCRNLLIYFDDEARTKAFQTLDRLTVLGGLLFLGHADRSDHDATSRFAPYADSASFVYRKENRVAARLKSLPLPPSRPIPPATRPAATPPPTTASAVTPNPAIAAAPPATPKPATEPPPGAAPQADPPSRRDDRDKVLANVQLLADQGRYEEAKRLVRQWMGSNSLDASAHFLLGIIQQAAGNRAEAEAELTKAIYLDREHEDALLALALLARRKGDMAGEAFYRRRAERVAARKGRS